MKTTKISKHTRKLIEEYREEGESINDAVNRLLKSSEPLRKIDSSPININLNEATLDILNEYKSYPTEPHSVTLMQLLENL